MQVSDEGGGQGGGGGECGLKRIPSGLSEGGWVWRSWFLLCILLCILLSPLTAPPLPRASSFSRLKLELTPEVLMHLSTPHTVHKDTYVVCWMSGQESRVLGKWNEIRPRVHNWRRRAGMEKWRTTEEEKKWDKMEERERDNDIKCILNSKHRPHYEKISTFRMHKSAGNGWKPRKSWKRKQFVIFVPTRLLSGYCKRYLIFRAVLIENIILCIRIVFLALYILIIIKFEIFT